MFAKEDLPEAFCTRCELAAKILTDRNGRAWVWCKSCGYRYLIETELT